MADKASESKTKLVFPYTSGEYWEGSSFPFWVQMLITALPTGFLGIDHLLFHSPQTALQKLLVNCITFGLWYFYDIIQCFADREYVSKYGLSRPIVGPTGLAYQAFRGVVGEDKQNGPDLPPVEKGQFSSIFLIAYLALIFVPFGISNFLAGDTSGGVIKFIFSFLFFGLLLPFVIIASIYDVYIVLSDPTRIYEKGVALPPPFSWLVGSDHLAPNLMKPSAFENASKPQGSLLTRFIQPVLDALGLSSIMQMLGAAKCAAEPVIDQAQKTVNAATTAASGAAALAATVPEVATKVTGQLQAFTDPEKLKAAAAGAVPVPIPAPLGAVPVPIAATAATAATAAVNQTGGGLGSPLDSIFFLSIGVLLIGAISLSAVRWMRNIKTQKNDRPPESQSRDDTPPQPNNL